MPKSSDAQIIQDFLADRGLNTTASYGRWVRRFIQHGSALFTKPFSLKDVTYSDLSEYRQHLVDRGLKQNSVVVQMRCILSLLSFAHDMGHLESNPGVLYGRKARGMMHREPTLDSKIISQDDIQRVLRLETDPYHRLFMQTLYATALRVSECVSIDLTGAVAKNDGYSILLKRKGGQMCYITIPTNIYDRLLRLGARPFPFTRYEAHKIVKSAGIRAGVPMLSCHVFRHCAVSHSIANGATVVQAQKLAGHKSLDTTTNYCHSTGSASDFLDIGGKENPGLELVG